MPRKFSIGLGNLGALQSSQGGVKVETVSGSSGPFDRFTNLGTLIVATQAEIDQTKVILSQDSSTAYHSTLFEDFGLRARPVYNFYVSDEQLNAVQDPSASLDDLPRYVEVSWTPTPRIRVPSPSSKSIRQPKGRPVPPIMPVEFAKVAVANGYVSPGVISALVVAPVAPPAAPAFNEDHFLSSPSSVGRDAVSYAETGSFHTPPLPGNGVRVRVNFIDPSIAGALHPNRISVGTEHEHLASLGSFAKLAAGLEVISEFNQDVPTRNPAPQFPASPDSPGLRYVGYVLERYTLDQSGSMTLTRTINIDDPAQARFVDRDVIFGGRYSYRIRSLVQWTRDPDLDFQGLSTLSRGSGFDISSRGLRRVASFYSGDWSDWARAEVSDEMLPDPPDEFTVRPCSPRRVVYVSWKMPWDPQRDISAFRLLRAISRDGRLGDWVQLGEFVPGNGQYVDRDVVPFEEGHASYVYAMYSVSFHGELSVLTERIEAEITGRSRYHGERPVRQLGPRGDDPMSHARGTVDPPDTELIFMDRAVAYVRGARSTVPLFDRSYVMEVQSLETGERVEVGLAVDTTDVDLTARGGGGRA